MGARGLGALPLSRCDPPVIINLGVCVKGVDPAALTGREANGITSYGVTGRKRALEGLLVILFLVKRVACTDSQVAWAPGGSNQQCPLLQTPPVPAKSAEMERGGCNACVQGSGAASSDVLSFAS